MQQLSYKAANDLALIGFMKQTEMFNEQIKPLGFNL